MPGATVETATGSVVCGVDFSPESARALACASALAARLSCSLHLVTAIEPLLTEAARLRRQLDAFTDQVARDLREFAGAPPLPADRVTFEATSGEPAPVLIGAATAHDARLIVVGTRGRGKAARVVLGSTTQRLLRTTDRPVLVTDTDDREAAPDEALRDAVSRIVCGVDFSDGSLAAAETAARLAKDLGAGITLVHAVTRGAAPVGWDALVGAVEAERVAEATSRLRDVAGTLTVPGTVCVRAGSPADVLAEEVGADLHAIVAVGLRGYSRHRPGSTALSVVTTTRVPVLAVPA
jgi:nucleotide-binding universal stress UspA family protein